MAITFGKATLLFGEAKYWYLASEIALDLRDAAKHC